MTLNVTVYDNGIRISTEQNITIGFFASWADVLPLDVFAHVSLRVRYAAGEFWSRTRVTL